MLEKTSCSIQSLLQRSCLLRNLLFKLGIRALCAARNFFFERLSFGLLAVSRQHFNSAVLQILGKSPCVMRREVELEQLSAPVDQLSQMNLTKEDEALWTTTIWDQAESPDLDPSFFIASGIWLTLNFLLGIGCNGIVLVAFFRNAELRTPFNWLLVNLISSDFCMLLLGVPPEIVAAFEYGWTLGYYPCIAQGMAMVVTGMGTVYSLVMLSIQRCIIVWQPIFYCTYGSKMTKIQSAIIWIMAAIIACPHLWRWNDIVPEKSGLSCGPCFMDEKCFPYAIFILILGYLVPLSIIFICAILTLVKVKLASDVAGKLNKKKASILARERRVTKMIFLMIVAFLGAWSGYAILGIIRIHGYADFSDYLIGVAMMLAKCGAWTNTIIFIWMNQEFRKVILPQWILNRYFSDSNENITEHHELKPIAKNLLRGPVVML